MRAVQNSWLGQENMPSRHNGPFLFIRNPIILLRIHVICPLSYVRTLIVIRVLLVSLTVSFFPFLWSFFLPSKWSERLLLCHRVTKRQITSPASQMYLTSNFSPVQRDLLHLTSCALGFKSKALFGCKLLRCYLKKTQILF